jgi:histone-lysine N-methyltransferase SETD2
MKAEYETDLGLGLDEISKLEIHQVPLELDSGHTEGNLIAESKDLSKSGTVDQTTEEDSKAEAQEDCLLHIQEISDDQQLTVRSNDDESERKQVPAFRSRSGSTDTTGSESSSNCSSGVRRSSRIRSIGIMKQRAHNRSDTVETPVTLSEKDCSETKMFEGRDSLDTCSGTDTQSDKENMSVSKIPLPVSSPSTLQGLVTPTIPGYDGDSCKPVKVKSRWRRSSELEMVGRRSSDRVVTATPPTPNLSPRPMIPVPPSLSPRPAAPATPNPVIRPVFPDNIPSLGIIPLEQPISGDVPKRENRNDKKEKEDREMDERLRNFERLVENEYLTER